MAKPKFSLRGFWKKLGPGLITGASDDDPSGIATYSQAGAGFGPKLLWTAIATYPLMVSIQQMCARIGIVTGSGLSGIIKKHYSKSLLYVILLLSFPSVTINIGADIAAMGAVGNMLFPGVSPLIFSIAFTGLLLYSTIRWSYRRIATVLKWLCLGLFSYIAIPFISGIQWDKVLRDTFVPALEWNKEYLMALVGILGTTISPYLFFWQASMEVEERNQRKIMVDKHIIEDMQTDVRWGMGLTNLVFYFIILTTGTVLFKAGIHQIETVEQAAEALRPLAGNLSYALFALGVIGTGLLAIPVLGGSLSYMLAEAFDWESGLDKKFNQAKGFYITLIVSLILGLGMHFLNISPVKALILTAILYGVSAPILIAVILHICNKPAIMGKYVNTKLQNFAGGTSLVLMLAAALAFIGFLTGLFT
ncbi:MAG: divalent metal cation transporter [Bacteroidetes bacterium]|nr:divalent metal cation transporter [Bacteroidota bacterium]